MTSGLFCLVQAASSTPLRKRHIHKDGFISGPFLSPFDQPTASARLPMAV